MTDVPIKDHTDALIRDLVRFIEVIDRKNERYGDAVDQKNQEALKAALAAEQLARSVALAEIKGSMHSHNDLIRKGEHERAETTAQMVTKLEFRPVADFVERSRQNSITTAKFITYLLAAIGLAMTFGFGFANYLHSARQAAIAAEGAQAEPGGSNPRVVIPLPPARQEGP